MFGLVAVVTALGAYLLKTYSVKAYSDPAQWYHFGANFSDLFGAVGLAYGFPFAVATAIRIVGPFNAFLINIPILLVLVALLYYMGKWHVRSLRVSMPGIETLGGAVTVLIFIALNKDMLGYLSSPYRDPLSFLFVLLACILLMMFRHQPGHALWLPAASAACLAGAGSVRETSFLMAAPLLLYALVEKRRDRTLRFWLPMLVFGIVFGIFCIPFFLQNVNTIGSALVPAQAGAVVANGGSVVPGITANNLWQGIPGTAIFLVHHYGLFLCGLLLAGLVFAAIKKNGIVICISASSLLMYFVFYGGYSNVYSRYLFVLDIFAAPVMSFSAISAVVTCSAFLKFRTWESVFKDERCWLAASAIVFLAGVTLSLNGITVPQERFTLRDAKAFSQAIESVVAAGDTVIAERPLHGIMKCFTHVKSQSLRTFGRKNTLRDPSAVEDLTRCVESRERVYFAHHSALYQRFVQSEYDLVGARTYVSAEYGLRGLVANPTVHLSRIRPWGEILREDSVPVEAAGAYILSVDVGRFSKVKRQFSRIRVDGEIVDTAPVDGINYYHVVVTNTPRRIAVRVESDAPVPQAGAIALQPVHVPVVMSFKKDDILPYLARFSDDFKRDPGMRYPGTRHRGYTLIPTPGRDRATFIVQANVALMSRAPNLTRPISVSSDGHTLFEAEISNLDWQLISFPLMTATAPQGVTRLDWALGLGPDAEGQPYLMLQQLAVHRVQSGLQCQIDLGRPGDDAFIIDGLYDREHAPGDPRLHMRWTQASAQLRIIMQAGTSPVRIKVKYFDKCIFN